MQKGALVYEGKAKQLFLTPDPEVLYVQYKNSATAFNGEKKEEIEGKAQLNNQITALLFERLKEQGIPSHFIEQLSPTEQLVRKVDIIPLEVVVRNIAAGSLAKRLGFDEGQPLKQPLVEFYYKDDALGDPLLTDAHIALLELVSESEKQSLEHLARQINTALQEIFVSIGVTLVDFKVEFGRTADGEILLADEISPDTCRLWDKETNQKLDKDVFRRNLGNLTDGYSIILSRLGGNSQ
ncbi:phosphoribosylaminoimidazolesuccinocarboxamide synthase [Chryseomicrobium excrementi]|uniref:Phosphoribosylaminoimidazole-succinocarboxamide synthase n=1 Tax=Chryseomicrobium excrementi TaxID=2041346 RepID=A0A2M9EWU4_9BACL|nr:phosphoribosylaminoimidazolesuccinocarboxamide synthase [Chryseomicrobium excrementi]PJK15675.1 phosphoribosylaminoimidazolesuccinocarboxamide synthase [Chryseomicrobium excrementi]